MVGYKRKDFWLDISARGKFGPGSRLYISARGILETSKIAWLGIGARQKFARIVVGYKRKGKIWTKIMVEYKRKEKIRTKIMVGYQPTLIPLRLYLTTSGEFHANGL